MSKLSNRELKIAGVLLYCCEGTRLRRDKRRKGDVFYWVIEFTNSNPKLVKLFLVFLRKIIKISESRLKGQLFIYDDLETQKLEKMWSKETGIDLGNFNKTIILRAKGSKYKPNPNGTFKVRYHSKEACQKLNLLVNEVLP